MKENTNNINLNNISDCLNSRRRSNVYHISISSKNKNDKKDAILKLLIDKRNLRDN